MYRLPNRVRSDGGHRQLETCPSRTGHMSDLPRHSVCTDERKRADGLENACFNGWTTPASAGTLAYRKRVAKLIFGLSRYHGRAFLGQHSFSDSKGEVTRHLFRLLSPFVTR
jgi:hypothetical protein